MRKAWLLVVAVALVLGAVALVVPRRAPARAALPTAPQARPPRLPAFRAEPVTQAGSELALGGRVLDTAGRPVAGAEVSLASSAEATLLAARCGECGEELLRCEAPDTVSSLHALLHAGEGLLVARLTTRTDAAGAFRFEHLAGVAFSVWARAPGLGPALRERAAPGEPVELFLPPARVLEGRVEDPDGRPVPRAALHVVSRRVPLPLAAGSGPDGTFRVEGLGEGPFVVTAAADGYLARLVPQAEPDAPLRVVLEPARTLTVEVRRGGAPAEARVRVVGSHLVREVVTEGGRARLTGLGADTVGVSAEAAGLAAPVRPVALAGARETRVVLELGEAGTLEVTVVGPGGEPVPAPELELSTARGEPVARRRAGTGERVGFGALAPGDYVVSARAAGFGEGRVPVHVAPGDALSVDVELERVTAIAGRVLDLYGRPAPGVSVLVLPSNGSVVTDADGRFEAPVPTPGLYKLHAHHSEWGGGRLDVTAPASDVELALEPRAAAEVTVVSGGRRVEGAEVALWQEPGSVFRADRLTGPDGTLPVRGLPPGSYTLVASHPDLLPSERVQVALGEGDVKRVTVELAPGAALAGVVLDERGVPVSGVAVGAVPRGRAPVVSDGQGRFELRALRPGRTYRLEARHAGYDQVGLAEGEPGGAPVTLKVRRRGTYRGRVVGEDGAPLERFRLDEHEVASPDGRFEVALPAAGERVLVALEAPGFEPQVLDRPAAVPDLGDLVLKRAPRVTGVVKDGAGSPVAQAAVSCEVCEDTVLTDAQGRFTLSRPPFVARFAVTAEKGRLSATEPVTRGGDAEVLLTLRAATRVSGVLYGTGGRPQPGMALEALQADTGEARTLVTDAAGAFRAELAPGTWRFAPAADVAWGGRAWVVQVGGDAQTLLFGPAPGTSALAVRVRPERGHALWLVAGEAGPLAGPAQDALRARTGQVVFQPRTDVVTFEGLAPGHYTLVWAPLYALGGAAPEQRGVDVPSVTEVSLGP